MNEIQRLKVAVDELQRATLLVPTDGIGLCPPGARREHGRRPGPCFTLTELGRAALREVSA